MSPSEIQPVIDSLQKRGKLPADIPASTRAEIARSMTRYFNWVGKTKVQEMTDAAADVARKALETEQEARPGTSLTTTVGESPATARGVLTDFIESMGPDNIASTMNIDFFLRIPQEVAAGAAQFMAQNFDQVRVDEFPALELVRVYDREVPRGFKRGPKGALVPDPDNDWPTRFEAACEEAGDDDALAAFKSSGRMVALKDSGVWQALGDGAGGYDDTLGNPYAPFAFNSGYDTDEVDREDAEALGLLDAGEQANPAKLDFEDLLNVPSSGVESKARANKSWRQLHGGAA